MASQVNDTTEAVRPATRNQRRKLHMIVDTDVHHGYGEKSALFPYLDTYYRDRFSDFGFGAGGGLANNGGFRGRRADTIDVEKPQPDYVGTTAFDVEDTREELFDKNGISYALLTGGQTYGAGAMMDLDYASALCRAFNDFTIEHWLAADDRFRFAMAICHQDPHGAAAEIDRLGSHPAITSVMLPCGATRPLGHRFYHPIYEACVRNGLSVAMHFGGEGSGVNPPPTAAGYPSYYIESRLARPSFYAVHLSSFIFEGVFDRFPSLMIAMLEAGFAWIPPYMWRMDLDWKGLRHQTPWVRELPSAYVKRHFRFATQPMEEPENPAALKDVIDWIDGANTLMFATDFPHWDWDDPAMTLTGLPDAMRQRIFAGNAIEFLNLTPPPAQAQGD